jgi:hypothetical protein
MKKNILSLASCLTFSAVFILSTNLYAANAQIVGPTGTIADKAGTGRPGIEVKVSPGVNLGYTLVAGGASFATTTANKNVKYDANATVQSRNEYGIASDYPGYYMRPANADTLATPESADSNKFNTGATGNAWVKQ